MRTRLLALTICLLVAGAACKRRVELFCDEDTPCEDPERPFCDLEGEFPASEGHGNTCIPNPFADGGVAGDGGAGLCQPNEPLRCEDSSTAVVCNSDGTAKEEVPCDLGCSDGRCHECEPDTAECAGGEATFCSADGQIERIQSCPLGCNDAGSRCNDVAPSNDLGIFLDMTDGEPAVTLTDGAEIDTDSGDLVDGDGSPVQVTSELVSAPSNGVAVRVFIVGAMTLGNTEVTGDTALAIVSDGDVEIRGKLALNSAGAVSDSDPCVGGIGEKNEEHHAYGGNGGGGFATTGGEGGDVEFNGLIEGGAGGTSSGNAALEPLRGGCPGGGLGGDAGGAVQVVSRSEIRFALGTVAGHIDASGEGGRHRINEDGQINAGVGGGSGGGILLEAPDISLVNGTGLVANGGGGGGGCTEGEGESGIFSTTAAGGAECSAHNRGSGGEGGALASLPGDGEGFVELKFSPGGGGGGGSVGRIRINTADGTFTPASGSIVSPAPSVGTLEVR